METLLRPHFRLVSLSFQHYDLQDQVIPTDNAFFLLDLLVLPDLRGQVALVERADAGGLEFTDFLVGHLDLIVDLPRGGVRGQLLLHVGGSRELPDFEFPVVEYVALEC